MAHIICGFPGIGKSTFFNKSISTSYTVTDSDSSNFDKSNFPQNYIEHIKNLVDKVDIILVSTHESVLDSLESEEDLDIIIVYPKFELKEEYLKRYKSRGSTKEFIKNISDNWEDWIEGIESRRNCTLVELNKGEYLSDVITIPSNED